MLYKEENKTISGMVGSRSFSDENKPCKFWVASQKVTRMMSTFPRFHYLQTSRTFMQRYIQTLEKDNNTNGRRPEGFQVRLQQRFQELLHRFVGVPSYSCEGMTNMTRYSRKPKLGLTVIFLIEQEAPLAYDAIWAVALALNKTIVRLKQRGEPIENFTYTNKRIMGELWKAMNATQFLGVSVSWQSFRASFYRWPLAVATI